ncbi:tetratricopeptide repeat protein [Acidisphaera rubrifaciens]|nr:tetratricopeptide repeat protein [Acidisphaera rubrifaciens]
MQARPGAVVVDIFDEVEQDLQAERTARLLRKYGWVIIAAAVLVVAATAGWQAWRWRQDRLDAAAAHDYMVASRTADPAGTVAATAQAKEAALARFQALAADGTPGYRVLARLRAAALMADAGNLAGASALWDEVAHDDAAGPLLQGLATLTWAQHHVDTGDAAAVTARLQPLLAPASPWHALAEETQAAIDLRQGHTDAARSILQTLQTDTGAPDGVRGRAGELLAKLAE